MNILELFQKPLTEIIFEPKFLFSDDFLNRLNALQVVRIASEADNYFETISQILMNDNNPYEYIKTHYPKLLGTPVLKIYVSYQLPKDLDGGLHFLFEDSMSEETFKDRIHKIILEFKKPYNQIVESNSGVFFYKKYLILNSIQKKNLADSYFIFKDFSRASSSYEQVQSIYADYSKRMNALCKLLIKTDDVYEQNIIDVLYLQKNVKSMYFASKLLPKSIKLGFQYWISKQELCLGMKALISYIILKDAYEIRNAYIIGKLRPKLDEILHSKLESSIPERNNVIKLLISKIDATLNF